jgi:hypothetical protein
MKWYYQVLGGHTHVRVFLNGGKCGDLVFRNEEFELIRNRFYGHEDWDWRPGNPARAVPLIELVPLSRD